MNLLELNLIDGKNVNCQTCGIIYNTTNEDSTQCIACQFPKTYGYKAIINNPQEIIIKTASIDTSKLKNGTILDKPFRPDTFDSYIGQESLKSILKGYIKGCKELNRPFSHFLVDGKAGTGKTAIAYILAKQLNLKFVECVASSIKNSQELIDKLVEVDGGILFIDELHTINKQVANFILPMMEDFQINGEQKQPFSLFASTTEKGILLKKFRPLVDRFKIQKTLDSYTISEITQIIKNYKEKVFPQIKCDDSLYTQIAQNSRLTPRIAIRLLESFIFMNRPLQEIFKAYNIVKDGITDTDIKLLGFLNANKKGLGINTICAYLQTSKENYMYSIESYLIEKGYLAITNNRQITVVGQQFLGEI